MRERISLTDEYSYIVTDTNENAATNIAWFKSKGASYLDGTETLFDPPLTNFNVEDQPQAGLREIIRLVLHRREKISGLQKRQQELSIISSWLNKSK